MPSATSAVLPQPLSFSTFTGIRRRVERDAHRAEAVVGRLRDGAGDVRAVALIVVGVRVVGDEAPPAHAPGAGQIGALREGAVVFARDARVDDGDGHASARREVPRARRAHARHVPLLAEQRIVGLEHGAHAGEGLGALDAAVAPQLAEQLGHARGAHVGQVDARRAREPRRREREPEIEPQRAHLGVVELVVGVDHHHAGHVPRIFTLGQRHGVVGPRRRAERERARTEREPGEPGPTRPRRATRGQGLARVARLARPAEGARAAPGHVALAAHGDHLLVSSRHRGGPLARVASRAALPSWLRSGSRASRDPWSS
jgi:hypothetical protein